MHVCDAALVACIDFRFQDYIRTWIDQNLGGKKYDYIGLAGSTKNLDTIITQIKISKDLHQIKEVHLMHHEECGAYGAESSFEKHSEDLKLAKERIFSIYPDLKVNLYHITLSGEFQEVE